MRYAVVVVFEQGISRETVLREMARLKDLENLAGNRVLDVKHTSKVRRFDPEQGWPVFYIP